MKSWTTVALLALLACQSYSQTISLAELVPSVQRDLASSRSNRTKAVHTNTSNNILDLLELSPKQNESGLGVNATTTTATVSTRHIQGVARELATKMSENFGRGFRSQDFPCDESSHRSVYWAEETQVPDTPENRKKYVLETLDYLQRLLNKYDVAPWWICSGTLLGSVRGGGFIPWDSDADVSVTWAAFDQLRAAAPTMEIDSRFALDLFPEGCFGEIEMRWVSKYGLGARLWDTHSGFYVDIFTWKPYGPLPQAHSLLRGKSQQTGPNLDDDYPFAGIRNSHISFQGAPGWNSSTYMWFVPRKVIFLPGTQRPANCSFDNMTLPCPVDPDWWLRNEYGEDYMTPDHAVSEDGEWLGYAYDFYYTPVGRLMEDVFSYWYDA